MELVSSCVIEVTRSVTVLWIQLAVAVILVINHLVKEDFPLLTSRQTI